MYLILQTEVKVSTSLQSCMTEKVQNKFPVTWVPAVSSPHQNQRGLPLPNFGYFSFDFFISKKNTQAQVLLKVKKGKKVLIWRGYLNENNLLLWQFSLPIFHSSNLYIFEELGSLSSMKSERI